MSFCMSEMKFCGKRGIAGHPAPLPLLIRLHQECAECAKLDMETKESNEFLVARGRKRIAIVNELSRKRMRILREKQSIKSRFRRSTKKRQIRALCRSIMRAARLVGKARGSRSLL